MDTLKEALKAMPFNPSKLYGNYTFLIEMSKGIKTKSYYQLIASNALNEVSNNENVFNAVQQAYYNTELATNGIIFNERSIH